MDTLGQRIRFLRQARGMSQQDLAEAVGVTKQAVCQWETGRIETMKRTSFLRVSEILQTSPDFLVHGTTRRPAIKLENPK
ncbi:MAG: helix-turn-helix domain-containing protein [Steroidobacterales bacterium]